MQTPEERRDEFLSALYAAGGTVIGIMPLAHPDTPHEIAAYTIRPGYPQLSVISAVDAVVGQYSIDPSNFVPWEPEDDLTSDG